MQFKFASIGSTIFLFAILAIALSTLPSYALPANANVPGGVAVVRISGPDDAPPKAWFRGRHVLVERDDMGWFALVGLPLDTQPGAHELKITRGSPQPAREARVAFAVNNKTYPAQHITLTDKSKVEPGAEDLRRIKLEQARIDSVKNRWQEAPGVDLALQLPAEGKLSGRFGVRRFFNGQPRNPHAGLDLAVPSGTPVNAAAAGTVTDIGDYFFNGNTVFIDHGQGLITMYCHLSEVTVKVGDKLKRGQQLGLSGMTGRATGPHLHWSVILNGAAVDPEAFIAEAAAPNPSITPGRPIQNSR